MRFLSNKQPIRLHTAVILAFSSLFVTVPVTNAQVADPLLQAMKQELDRSQAKLMLPGMQRPYFIEYRLEELTDYEAVASYGALNTENHSHQRAVRVTVRIGSYKSDSSSARGDGNVQLSALDNNPDAIRYALWLATDDAYKSALRAYSAKQAALKRFETPPTADDFAPTPAIVKIEPLVTLDLDTAAWKQRIIEASGLYATDPATKSFADTVQYATASVRGIAVNRYTVNTEGTMLRHGYTGYTASFSVGGQAADGMRLSRDNGSTARLAKDLESAEAFHQRALNDILSYRDLRKAPVVSGEDYHGPVLFSGDASADTLNRLFVPNVEADRPEPGTTARTQGAYSSSLHARVLPELLSATDNPLLGSFAGRHLVGAYDVDDEGVPAESVNVVVNGKLENFLIGREPVRDVSASNGHGRAAPAQAARSHSGVMLFTARQQLSDKDMTDHLLALAREQKRDVYAVDTLAGEAPRVLWLVHPDGSRQLVRGASFDELDNRSLRSSVVAAGGTPYIANTIGPIPQTTIAPSLLFDDIGVKRASEEQQKLPYYPPPPVGGR